MPKKVGKLKLYMGPRQVGGPDDLLRGIVGFIDGVKRKLDIAVQELDNREIADANRQKRCAQYAPSEIDRIIKDFGIKI